MFLPVTLQLLAGFGESLKIFLLTLLFALPLGLVICFGSMSKFSPLRKLTRCFVWIIRGTPLMLQLIIIFFGPGLMFGMSALSRFTATIVAFSINYAAYFGEIYRSGIESMPVGQYEAAEILGYRPAQTFVHIILPQVIKRVLPALTNELVTLVKDTSLAFSLAYMEMFTIAKQIAAKETTFIPFVVAGIFYFIFNFVVAAGMEWVEKRFGYYR